jgi:hypothetical protein
MSIFLDLHPAARPVMIIKTLLVLFTAFNAHVFRRRHY